LSNIPIFSIIIPCHNYGRFLKRAIDSVLAQSLQNYEIIVVNDASTDDTEKIVMDYGDKIKYIPIDKNVGPGSAWVEGLKNVNGKYICKLDADDWLLNDFLIDTKRIFERDHHIGIVVSSTYDYLEGENNGNLFSVTTTDKELKAHEFRKRLLKEFFMRMPSTVLRHEAIKDVGLPIDELYIGHDWEYFLRISKKWKCFLLEKPGAVYRIHSRSVTKNSARTNRIMKDFQFWLDLSSKKATPYYINKKERRVLALAMAQTYLRIHGMPTCNIFYNYRSYCYFMNVGKLAAKESPLILPSLIWFVLRRITILLGRIIMKRILPTSRQKNSEDMHIKYLLPDTGHTINKATECI
jgi:glycosyltransferase involved in cell wall biosynthesis